MSGEDAHAEQGGRDSGEAQERSARAELAELMAIARVSVPQSLSPVPGDVPPEIRDLVETLRVLFGALGMSLNRLAALLHSDPGTVSRYLSGKRVPPPDFIDGLFKAVYDAKGALVTPQVQELAHGQFLAALRARHPARYEVQRLTDLLQAAAQEKRQHELTVAALEDAIANRNDKIYALELEGRQLRSAWARAEALLEEEREHRERLQQTIDSLNAEVSYLKKQLMSAQQRAAAAEARCRELEARLDSAGALLQDEDHTEAGPHAVPVIWGDIPQRNGNFTGRTEILTRLQPGSPGRSAAIGLAGPRTHVLQGPGGVGKTALAIEYAYRFGSAYDVIWWIPSDQLASVRASLAALAGRLGLETPAAAGIDGVVSAVLDSLRRGQPYSRWLLIFDNADQPEELQDYMPRGPGDILITTRNPAWHGGIGTLQAEVDVFTRSESQEFLSRRAPIQVSESDAGRLAEQLGDLPLALDQAGAMLAEAGMPVDDYLRLLDERPAMIMGEQRSANYPLSVTGAWKLSVAALQQRMPPALELLRCCAFFGPEPIPVNVLRRGAQVTGTAVAEVISDPILRAAAIRELARYALVTLDGSTIRVHRLIQALLRDELTDEQRAGYRHEAQLNLAGAAPYDPDDAKTWPRFRELLPHVNSDSLELPRSPEPVVRDLALAMMRYLYQSGDYPSALSLTERFIEQWIRDSGPDSADVLRAQRHLGNILRNLGRYQESYRVTEDALANCIAKLGEDDPTTLTLRTSFGADLRARGSFGMALELDNATRDLVQESYRPDDPRTLRQLSSLALDYALTSEYSRARDLYEEAFRRMSPAGSGATAIDVLGAWTGISWTLRLMGWFQEAFDVGQDALEFGQDPAGPGPEHLTTLRAINAFTIASRRIPDKRLDALELGKKTLELSARLFGDSHPDTLAFAVALSNLLRTISVDLHGQALALAESTVSRYPGVYGDEHPYNYGCLSNLALLRRVTGDPSTARELDEKALEGLTATIGPDHHFTLAVAMNLASDFAALGRPRESRRLGEDTWPRLSALLGETHPHTLSCAANLSLDIMASGDEQVGRSLREQSLRSMEEAQGRDFPDLAVAATGKRLDPDFDPMPI